MIHRARWESVLAISQKVAWVLFIITLPVTSFPFFPPVIGGAALVRPLSIYPLLVLLFLVTLPRLVKKSLPKALLSLLPFVLLATASSLLSLLRGIEPVFGVSVGERILRTLITLGVGIAIYMTVVLGVRTLEDLRTTLRWLYTSFSLSLLWGSMQAIYILHFSQTWFQFMSKIQSFISIRRLFQNRVSGLTYEPNWFAEQITFLIMPWLIASVMSGHTVFRWRWRWFTLEWFLLGWSVALLPFTYSRSGVMSMVILAFFSVFLAGVRASRKKTGSGLVIRNLLVYITKATLAVVILAGIVYAAGTKNEFFSRIWSYWIDKQNPSIAGYIRHLGFGARITYSEAALRTYEAYPVFGVGLGNYAFYFGEMLPERPLAKTPEVLRVITPEEGRNRLITPKNFYVRLLAETGLVGTAAFTAFLITIAGCALYLWLSPQKDLVFWGTAGLLGLIAFGVSSFSFDSFAIPNMWVIFGLITAAAWIFSRPTDHEPIHAIE